MGQTATRHVAEDQATAPAGAAAAAAAVTALPSASSPLPQPPVAPLSLLQPESPEAEETSEATATAAGAAATSDMAASSACKVSFRESLAKMRWTASSLEALRAAEDKLLVSE